MKRRPGPPAEAPGGRRLRRARGPVNPSDGVWLAVGWLPDGSGILAVGASEREPEDLWILPVPAPDAAPGGPAVGPAASPARCPAVVPVAGFVEPERLAIRARDGLPIPMTLWRPAGRDRQARRAHGPDHRPRARRPHVAGSYRDFQPFRQLLAQEGFAFLSVDFRGSTGYGPRLPPGRTAASGATPTSTT